MKNDMSERILDLAERLIMERGYKAFSYNDLSKEIGIKTSSIHYHYPTKGDLGRQIVLRYIRLCNEVTESIDNSTENPKKKIREFINLFFEHLKSADKACPIAMLASDYENLPEDVKEELINCIETHEVWITKVLKSGLEKKIFKFTDSPENRAKAIFFAIEGATIAARAFSDSKRIQMAENMIINSIT